MKKVITLLFTVFCSALFAADYYFDVADGKDSNSGTSKQDAFQSLSMINTLELGAGDQILLKRGQVFFGNIELAQMAGSKEAPIVVGAYGEGKPPLVNAKGKLNALLIQDCSHILVQGLELTANGGGLENVVAGERYTRCGVLVTAVEIGNYENITVKNMTIHDIFFEEPNHSRTAGETLTGNGTQNYGWGIRVLNSNENAVLDDIKILNNHIERVSHSGIRFTGKHALALQNDKNIKNALIKGNKVVHSGGPAMQASVVENVKFVENITDHSGSPTDSRNWARGSGLWVWGCYNALIEHNQFRHANGPGDSAGCHIDFNNKNVIIQYNVSENNAGGFVEILGNNHNCTYRYNVSINDGTRKSIEGETLGAGTMIGINGFVGFGKPRIGPFNIYLYNNTIYVKKGINPEVGFAKTLEGIMVANNIFYIEDYAVHDPRKAFLPSSGPISRVFFENNLYLDAKNWPSADDVMITDQKPLYGDPLFAKAGGKEIEDYIPQHKALVKNKGIDIPFLPNDSIGIIGGFGVDVDILGNKIKGKPDMGAIEL